jgi:hypothetical protein
MNCERCWSLMGEGATGGLSSRRLAEFELHIRACSACHQEFERVRTLVAAVDRRVTAQVAAEPSSELLVRIRRRISAESAPAQPNWQMWAPVTAGVALAVIAAGLWMMRPKIVEPRRVATKMPALNQSVTVNHPASNPARVLGNATVPEANPDFASVRRVAAHKQHRISRQPEVLVPPGQSEALLQFVAALESGKLDGAKLLAEQHEANQPIVIKPLVIPPLETTARADSVNSGPAAGGTEKNFVSENSTQGLKP